MCDHTKAKVFNNAKSLQMVILAGNRIVRLKSESFKNMKALVWLDLRENPLFDIDYDVLVDLPSLRSLHSDVALLCCIASQTKSCQPKPVISCSKSFLPSLTIRITIFVQSILVLSNVAVPIIIKHKQLKQHSREQHIAFLHTRLELPFEKMPMP